MLLIDKYTTTLLIISTLLLTCLFLAIFKNKKANQIRLAFLGLILCLIICCFGQLLQVLLSNSLHIDPIYFDYFVYIGTCFLPVGLFFLGLIFAKTKITFKKSYLLLLVIPIVSLLTLWTNDYHHLFYKHYSIFSKDTIFGPYAPIHLIYSYTLIAIGLLYLFRYSIKNSGFFSKQSLLIVLGSSIPLTINILGFMFVQMTIYITPISFSWTTLLYALAIFKFKFLSASPIALQRVVDRISDSFIVLNEENIIIDFNDTFLKTFHVSAISLRNKNIFEILQKNNFFDMNIPALAQTLKNVKSSTQTYKFEKYLKEINRYFIMEINSITHKKDFLGTLVLFKDTTQHMLDIQTIKSNQDMLMEKERLASLGQLIGGIAHNLKTPIMSISGAAEGLNDLIKEYDISIDDAEVTKKDHHDIAKDMSSWVVKIKEYTEYMSDVITAVKGQAVTLSSDENMEFTIDELMKRIDILMRHELKNALINLNIHIQIDSNTTIKGDVNSLVQVINNMISNSIQAYNGKPNQDIDLSVSTSHPGNLVISVRDYGMGMTQEVKQKLFKEMITTKGKNGTGLGLFMSYSTIKAHFGGNIDFTSEVGKGTCFNITLPLD